MCRQPMVFSLQRTPVSFSAGLRFEAVCLLWPDRLGGGRAWVNQSRVYLDAAVRVYRLNRLIDGSLCHHRQMRSMGRECFVDFGRHMGDSLYLQMRVIVSEVTVVVCDGDYKLRRNLKGVTVE